MCVFGYSCEGHSVHMMFHTLFTLVVVQTTSKLCVEDGKMSSDNRLDTTHDVADYLVAIYSILQYTIISIRSHRAKRARQIQCNIRNLNKYLLKPNKTLRRQYYAMAGVVF